jgi:hypothetical protein
MLAAATQGREAVRMVMQELSPGKSWAQAASDLVEAWEAIRPGMMWDDPEFGGTICFPPAERPLRKLLSAKQDKARNSPVEPDPAVRFEPFCARVAQALMPP